MSLLNKTTWLIMPMAFYEKGIKFNDILATGFVNAYIGDLHRPELDDKILLIFNDKEEVIEIPKNFENNYWKIITSQYHEISDDYWKIVADFWNESVKPPLEELDDFDIFEEIYNMCVE
jgi:hypothetical protein